MRPILSIDIIFSIQKFIIVLFFDLEKKTVSIFVSC